MIETVTITVQTNYKLTKNGMKNTSSWTIKKLTREHREIAKRLSFRAKKKHDIKKPLSNPELFIQAYYGRNPMDYDGLACAVAPAVDGLVDAGILEDDSPKVIEGYHLLKPIKVSKMSEQRVEVSVRGKR